MWKSKRMSKTTCRGSFVLVTWQQSVGRGALHTYKVYCSYQLLLGNQDKGSTPSLAQCLALPYGPSLHNLTNMLTVANNCNNCFSGYHCK